MIKTERLIARPRSNAHQNAASWPYSTGDKVAIAEEVGSRLKKLLGSTSKSGPPGFKRCFICASAPGTSAMCRGNCPTRSTDW